jgi:hypothetical protein
MNNILAESWESAASKMDNYSTEKGNLNTDPSKRAFLKPSTTATRELHAIIGPTILLLSMRIDMSVA